MGKGEDLRLAVQLREVQEVEQAACIPCGLLDHALFLRFPQLRVLLHGHRLAEDGREVRVPKRVEPDVLALLTEAPHVRTPSVVADKDHWRQPRSKLLHPAHQGLHSGVPFIGLIDSIHFVNHNCRAILGLGRYAAENYLLARFLEDG